MFDLHTLGSKVIKTLEETRHVGGQYIYPSQLPLFLPKRGFLHCFVSAHKEV